MTDEPEPDPEANLTSSAAPADSIHSNAIATLLSSFEREYDALLAKLTTRLRSREAAADALHDVYIKLRSAPNLTVPRNPKAYLYRAVIDRASNDERKRNWAVGTEPGLLEAVLDPTPDPERIAVAAVEMQRALAALHQLPPKRREIFLARWRDERTNEEIALAFGMHKRSVQKDLALTERYLRKILGWPGERSNFAVSRL